MIAKCYYMLSPSYSLDQENTNEAMEKLQIFIDNYPRSSYLSEANNYIRELQIKLEKRNLKYQSSIIQSETTKQQLVLWIIYIKFSWHTLLEKMPYIISFYHNMKLQLIVYQTKNLKDWKEQ